MLDVILLYVFACRRLQEDSCFLLNSSASRGRYSVCFRLWFPVSLSRMVLGVFQAVFACLSAKDAWCESVSITLVWFTERMKEYSLLLYEERDTSMGKRKQWWKSKLLLFNYNEPTNNRTNKTTQHLSRARARARAHSHTHTHTHTHRHTHNQTLLLFLFLILGLWRDNVLRVVPQSWWPQALFPLRPAAWRQLHVLCACAYTRLLRRHNGVPNRRSEGNPHLRTVKTNENKSNCLQQQQWNKIKTHKWLKRMLI